MSSGILILSEDTGSEGVATLRVLLRRIVNCFELGREVLPIRPGDRGKYPTVGGNLWRANTERASEPRRLLCKTIADALAQGGVVVFHTDADATWSSGRAPIIDDFERKIRLHVQQFLVAFATRQDKESGWVESRLERLLHVVPTWCIEAWTYQATEKAVELCEEQYGGRDTDQFVAWGADRSLLDEVEGPKDLICLRNKHNADLAAGVPLEDTIAARKSFERFVESLRSLSELRERMRC